MTKRPRLQTTTRLLLSAAMLFGSIVPPGRIHVHRDGDVPHDHHQGRVGDDSVNAHDHETGHHHHHPSGSVDSIAESIEPGVIAHVHFAFWLFHLTLPVRDGWNSTGKDDLYVARRIDDGLRSSTSGPDSYSFVAWVKLPGVMAAVQTVKPKLPQPPAPAVLLCDNARHERSGVQLF